MATENLSLNGMIDLFKGGIWTDYNGKDTNVRTIGEDGKSHTNYGAAAKNIIGNGAKFAGLGLSFIKDSPLAENSANNVVTTARKNLLQIGLQSGNPYIMAAAAASMLSDKIGGTASATTNLGTGANIANAAASFVPFLGFAGKKIGKKFESDLINSSSSYNWADRADGTFGGKIVFQGGRAKRLADLRNYKLNVADNILSDGKLSLLAADDLQNAQRVYNLVKRGGWNPLSGKHGTVLQFSRRTLSKRKYLIGGNVTRDKDGNFEINLQRDRTLDELIDFVEQQNPPFWSRMNQQDTNMIDLGDGWFGSLKMTWGTDDNGNAIVYPEIQYNDSGELEWFKGSDAYKRAMANKDFVIMAPDEAKDFTENYKQSTKLHNLYYDENEEPKHFKDGGKVNVIPEGALHKNKHHLEQIDEKFKDVTTKGIPVVVESEGGNLVLLAEVEKEEIIFRLEVTQKLEQLMKEGTDKAAIEAGKLLVHEILHNTIDKTNNMI